MTDKVLTVLTFKSVETILQVGGTQSWALDRNRAKACKYAVVCRNAKHENTEGMEAHGSAFMIGKIKDVVPSTETEGRWLVLFSEYALCNYGNQWEGRNPVAYWDTGEYGFDFETLKFQPMPEPMQEEDEPTPTPVSRLTIAEAKIALGLTFGVDPSAVEITIRG